MAMDTDSRKFRLVMSIVLFLFIMSLIVLAFILGMYTNRNTLRVTPSDYIHPEQIHIFNDSVCIDVENPRLSSYANSGSMKNTLDENSNGITIAINQSNISIGDIVTYEKDNELIIHRVINIKKENNETFYLMLGDNNGRLTDGWINKSQLRYKTIALIF